MTLSVLTMIAMPLVGDGLMRPRTASPLGRPGASSIVADQQDQARTGAAEEAAGAFALFQQPWWLDATAPGAWDVVELRRDGQVIGRLPYMRKQRLGLTILTQPPLTPYLGPWIAPAHGKYSAQLAHEHEVLRALVAALPGHDIFAQTVHPSLTNCLALHWCGFAQSTGYTYTVEDLSDLDRIWQDLVPQVRTKIRKAERHVAIRPSEDIDQVIELNRMTYARQGLAPPYPDALIRRIDAACRARGVRQILIAEDQAGVPQAASLMVWDEVSAYGLISGSNPEFRQSGAATLLKWAQLRFASQVSRRFDYAGSMLPQVEPAVRTLGTRQRYYARIARGRTLRGRLALMAQDLRRSRH